MTRGSKPTTAFVLAAGLGNRMRPLTDSIPKPLVPLAGKPLIDHVLDRLLKAGIKRAVVNVHYLADKLEAHLAARKDAEIIISDERGELLETGGGIVNALPLIGDGSFLIHNSDSVWIENGVSNLERLITSFEFGTTDCALLLAPVSSSLGYDGRGDFHLEPDGRLRRRGRGEAAPYVFAGVSIMHSSTLRDEVRRRFSLNEIWDRANSAGRLTGIVLDGLWMHVGTPDALKDAEAAIKESRIVIGSDARA